MQEEFAVDRAALRDMTERFRQGVPGASRQRAAATGALPMSAVMGFDLLRPVLVRGYGWSGGDDEELRAQLVRAMRALGHGGRATE